MNNKTLYISDLDGTLLGKNAVLSEYTAKTLKALSDKGVNISVATARTAATVTHILEGTGVNTPVVLMNGVCIYDLQKGRYVRACPIEAQAKAEIIKAVHGNGLAGFFYSIDDGALSTFYENTDSPGAQTFIEERRKKYGKVFTKVNSFNDIQGKNIVYYSVSDYGNKLAAAAERLKSVKGLHVEYYRDIYEKDCFFLEVCSNEASKRKAVDFIRQEYSFEKAVGFGDNYNDLPLLEACDEFYAVENAVDLLKEKATAVIGSNLDDSVAHFLEKLL